MTISGLIDGSRRAKGQTHPEVCLCSLTDSLDLKKWKKMVAHVVSTWFDLWGFSSDVAAGASAR